MTDSEKTDSNHPKKIKRSSFAVRVNYSTAERLENLVSNIKAKKNYSFSKQQWITDAIREKLESDQRLIKKTKFPKKVKIDKRLFCLIDEGLLEKLNGHLKHLQDSCDITASKNSWITQAINEKMENDS